MRDGSSKYQDDHFRRVADLYHEALDTERRPRAVVADLFDTTTATAGRWIREARQRGFIQDDPYEEQYPNTNLKRVAQALGVSPKDLATAIRMEAGDQLSIRGSRWS